MKTHHLFLGCLLALSGFSASAQSNCTGSHDSNGDGAVTISDLLDLLGIFGDTDSDSDGVWNTQDLCSDFEACNYSANPTEPCRYLDAVGDCGGFCEEDADGDGICDWTCGLDSVDFQGHMYPTTQIGDQCWLAQSIRYLPEVTPTGVENAYAPMAIVQGYYGTDVAEAMATSTYQDYGCVYNRTALEEWELCPAGWGVPSWNSGEFQALFEFAGGLDVAGKALKDSVGWNGTNEFGFKYLPIPGAKDNAVMANQPSPYGGIGTPVIRFGAYDYVALIGWFRQDFFQVRCMKD